MSRDIKRYIFQTASGTQIYSDNSGNVDLYTAHAIQGRLNKVTVVSGDHGNGSIYLLTSGTEESLLTKISFSGTNPSVSYPRVNIQNNVGADLPGPSGNVWEKNALIDDIHFAASGLGDTKFISSVTFYYE